MLAFKRISNLVRGISNQRPFYRFMKELDNYKISDQQQQYFNYLEDLQQRFVQRKLSDDQIKQMILNQDFKNIVNKIFELNQAEEEEAEVDIEKNISEEKEQKILAIQGEIITLLESKNLNLQEKYNLYAQTNIIKDVQKHLISHVHYNYVTPTPKISNYLLQVVCTQFNQLSKSPKTSMYFDLTNLNAMVENFQRREVLQSLSLQDIALLLEVDFVLFRQQLQKDLLAQAHNLILDIKSYDENEHLKGLKMLFKAFRIIRASPSKNSQYIQHLIEVLPIEVLNYVMKQQKLANFDLTEISKIFSALQKKHFSTYKAENIHLLSAMNVYMPAISAANFYLGHLQSLFDQGNYLEVMKLIPDYLNLFYPKFEVLNYFCDRLQVKLATSSYQTIDNECSKEQKVQFLLYLSEFLTSILYADSIKNEFFLMKTLLFINRNSSLIDSKRIILNFNYTFNQILENQQGDTELNPNIKEQILIFNEKFPVSKKLPTPSNTETKIFKFLLQTNHFALQNVEIGSFIVDILVHPDIIIEYNGFDHYKYDLKLKSFALDQYTLRHLYRERQLKKLKGYKIANINFKQWSTLYELEKQHNFVRNVVLSLE
ncbi:hypothetical protein ABPG72_002186 [Tetrahymena utriculariae]